MQDALQSFVLGEARYSSAPQLRVRCPACGPNRKLIHRNERTLSITIVGDKATFFCHHCPAKGAVPLNEAPVIPIRAAVAAPKRVVETFDLSPSSLQFLQDRGISAVAADACGVRTATVWFRKLHREGEALAFPYTDADGSKSFKYRSIEVKDFSCSGAPNSFFNVEAHSGDTLVVTEGELDTVAFKVAGVEGAVSVPNGATDKPLSDRLSGNNEGGKLGFLWTHRKLLERVTRVVIATDADGPGQIMGEEIARRVGKGKCFIASYPDGCKDAGDVLSKHGIEAVRDLVLKAKPVPVAGLHGVDEYIVHLNDLYKNGLKGGEQTGWPSVDKVMTIHPGMLYVCTGIPGSGKSSWIDALAVNLAKNKGWTTVMASFENPPPIHIAKLCSAYMGIPFGAGHSTRMSPEDLLKASEWVSRHFLFMSNDAEMPTVQSILDRAKVGVLRLGAKMVVMDPANFLQFMNDEDKNEQIDNALTQFKNFAMAHDVAFFLVAHPRKPSMGNNDWHPEGYDISGTAGFYNRTDIGLTIHRTPDDFNRVIVWKSRFAHIATKGEAQLSYDSATGTFSESFTRPQRPSSNIWDEF